MGAALADGQDVVKLLAARQVGYGGHPYTAERAFAGALAHGEFFGRGDVGDGDAADVLAVAPSGPGHGGVFVGHRSPPGGRSWCRVCHRPLAAVGPVAATLLCGLLLVAFAGA